MPHIVLTPTSLSTPPLSPIHARIFFDDGTTRDTIVGWPVVRLSRHDPIPTRWEDLPTATIERIKTDLLENAS